jgi:hypothetical protein
MGKFIAVQFENFFLRAITAGKGVPDGKAL